MRTLKFVLFFVVIFVSLSVVALRYWDVAEPLLWALFVAVALVQKHYPRAASANNGEVRLQYTDAQLEREQKDKSVFSSNGLTVKKTADGGWEATPTAPKK